MKGQAQSQTSDLGGVEMALLARGFLAENSLLHELEISSLHSGKIKDKLPYCASRHSKICRSMLRGWVTSLSKLEHGQPDEIC